MAGSIGGPAKKPVELQRLLGNPGKRALPKPKMYIESSGPPPMPTTLGPSGREAWQRLWSVAGPWLSPTTDVAIMTRLCEAYDERDELRKIIIAEGRVQKSRGGALWPHPAVAMLRALEAQITKWECLCGFTPSDRGRIGYAEVKTASKLQDFLAKSKTG